MTSLFDFDFFEGFFFELLFVPPIVGDGISSSISSGDCIDDDSFKLLIVIASAWEEFECDSCKIELSLVRFFDLRLGLVFDRLRFDEGVLLLVLNSPLEFAGGWRDFDVLLFVALADVFVDRAVWRPTG